MKAFLRKFWYQQKHRLAFLKKIIRVWKALCVAVPLDSLPGSSKYWGRPRRACKTVSAYAVQRGARITHHAIYPSVMTSRAKPVCLAEGMPHWEERLETKAPGGDVWEFENGRVEGSYGGNIIAADDSLIGDLSPDVWGFDLHRLRGGWSLPKCNRLEGVTAVLITPEAPTNYAHWIYDLLPRIHLLHQAGYTPDKVDRYLIKMTGATYQAETLAEMGIPMEKLQRVSPGDHWECEKLLVPSMIPNHDSVAPWELQFLKSLQPEVHDGKRKIFISRMDAKFRRLINESDLLEIFAAEGFEIIDPGTMSVKEQRRLFAEAAMVAGPHGAAFTNIFWCKPGTVILDILSPLQANLTFWVMAEACDLKYRALMTDPAQFPYNRFADYSVDVRKTKEVVKKVLEEL